VTNDPSAPSDKAWPENRPLHWRLRLGAVGLAGLCLGLLLWLGRDPWAVEGAFCDERGPRVIAAIGRITGRTSISVIEVLAALLIAWALVRAAGATASCARGRRRWRNASGSFALILLVMTSGAGAIFYGVWGVAYQRPALVDRVGWAPLAGPGGAPEDAGAAEVERLATELIELTNASYASQFGTDDLGHASEGPALPTLQVAIEAGYAQSARHLGLAEFGPRGYAPVKVPLLSPLMSRMGTSGIYLGFTGEPHINDQPPAWTRPQTMAHEMGHQRLFMSEDEANFAGFVACMASPDRYVQYAGLLFAQRQLLFEIKDRKAQQALVAKRLPGVQRDVDALAAYLKRYHGRLRTVAHAMNDAYLKANRVEGGVKSYRLSARLIVLLARRHGHDMRAAIRALDFGS
jgi:hypothetical protein